MRKIEPWFIRSLNDSVYEYDNNSIFDLSDPLWIHVQINDSIFTVRRYFCMYTFYKFLIGKINLNYYHIKKIVENEICAVDGSVFSQGERSPLIQNGENELPDLEISLFLSNRYFQPKMGKMNRIITYGPVKRKLSFGTFYICEYKEKSKV